MDILSKKKEPSPQSYVPYEIFKMAMDLNTENLKEIYSMMHQINMERPYSIEMKAGDFGFSVTGSREDADKIAATSRELTEIILKKVFSKDAMKLLMKREPNKEKPDGRSYA
jgi:hypothetical protein